MTDGTLLCAAGCREKYLQQLLKKHANQPGIDVGVGIFAGLHKGHPLSASVCLICKMPLSAAERGE